MKKLLLICAVVIAVAIASLMHSAHASNTPQAPVQPHPGTVLTIPASGLQGSSPVLQPATVMPRV